MLLQPHGTRTNRSNPRKTRQKHLDPIDLLRQLQRQPDNKKCADCQTKLPGNVNLTHFTFICTVCAGIHREFSHRVKGVGHSAFTEEEVRLMRVHGGNKGVNEVYLARYGDGERLKAPEGNSDEQLLRVWIRRKYLDKAWYEEKEEEEGVGKVEDDTVKTEAPVKVEVDLFGDNVMMQSSKNVDHGGKDEWDAFGGSTSNNASKTDSKDVAFVADFGSTDQEAKPPDAAFEADFSSIRNDPGIQNQSQVPKLSKQAQNKQSSDFTFEANFGNNDETKVQASPVFEAAFDQKDQSEVKLENQHKPQLPETSTSVHQQQSSDFLFEANFVSNEGAKVQSFQPSQSSPIFEASFDQKQQRTVNFEASFDQQHQQQTLSQQRISSSPMVSVPFQANFGQQTMSEKKGNPFAAQMNANIQPTTQPVLTNDASKNFSHSHSMPNNFGVGQAQSNLSPLTNFHQTQTSGVEAFQMNMPMQQNHMPINDVKTHVAAQHQNSTQQPNVSGQQAFLSDVQIRLPQQNNNVQTSNQQQQSLETNQIVFENNQSQMGTSKGQLSQNHQNPVLSIDDAFAGLSLDVGASTNIPSQVLEEERTVDEDTMLEKNIEAINDLPSAKDNNFQQSTITNEHNFANVPLSPNMNAANQNLGNPNNLPSLINYNVAPSGNVIKPHVGQDQSQSSGGAQMFSNQQMQMLQLFQTMSPEQIQQMQMMMQIHSGLQTPGMVNAFSQQTVQSQVEIPQQSILNPAQTQLNQPSMSQGVQQQKAAENATAQQQFLNIQQTNTMNPGLPMNMGMINNASQLQQNNGANQFISSQQGMNMMKTHLNDQFVGSSNNLNSALPDGQTPKQGNPFANF